MELFKRRQAIVALIQELGEASVEELAARFGVSANTIRTDLNALAEEGLLNRVHRGAVSLENRPTYSKAFAARANVNRAAKERLGQWAAGLVKNGETIVLDASSTVFYLATFLRDRRDLTVITNGLEVALLLAQNPSNKIILAANTVRPDGLSLVGNLNPALSEGLFASKCFVSCLGFSLEHGLTESDVIETPLKAQLLKLARQVIALVDASKFGKAGTSRFAEPGQIDLLVTDDTLSPEMLTILLQALRCPITVVGASTTETFGPLATELGRRYRLDLGRLTDPALPIQQLRHYLAQVEAKLKQIEAEGLPGNLLHSIELTATEVNLVIEYQMEENTGTILMEQLNRAGLPVRIVETKSL